METSALFSANSEPDFASTTVLASLAFDQMLNELESPMNPDLEAFLAKKSIWID